MSVFWGLILLFQNFSFFDDVVEQPKINRELRPVATLNDGATDSFTRPYIPSLRYSADGRIGLKPMLDGTYFKFYLLTPVKLNGQKSFIKSTLETNAIVSQIKAGVSSEKFGSHVSLCDPTQFVDPTLINISGPDGKYRRNPFQSPDLH